MRFLAILFICAFLTGSSLAQEGEVDNAKNEFGAHLGATTGIGLSYRHWFNKMGVQITAIPVKTDDMFFGSLGLSGLYSLKKTKYVRAYLYLGTHILSTDDYVSDYDDNGNYLGDHSVRTTQLNVGCGPGFSFGRVVAFNLQIGYGIYDITDRFNILPSGEIGVYYMF